MIRRLEDFVRTLGRELQTAREASRRVWPDTRIASMNLDLSATVERVDNGKALALRVGRARSGKASFHQLSIDLSDGIAVNIDGKLLARYGSAADGDAN